MSYRNACLTSYLALTCIGTLPGTARAAGLPVEASHVIRIERGAMAAASRIDLQSVRAFDYGTFVWMELPSAGMEKLQAAGIAFEEQQNPYTLTLGEQSFDPVREVPSYRSSWGAARSEGADLRLVQYFGPSRSEWMEALTERGVRVVQYIHPFTYIVWSDAATLGAATRAAEVRWTGSLLAAHRVLLRWQNLDQQLIQAHVMVYRGSDVPSVVRSIDGIVSARDSRSVIDDTFEVLSVRVAGSSLRQLADLAGVYSVQPVPTNGGLRGEMSDQVNVNNVNGSNVAFPGYLTWLGSVGLSGNGVIIANVDSGVQDTHPNLVNRMVPCSGTTCGGATSSSHGTHTAGIMAADGTSGTADGFGFQRGLGMAPGAHLVEQLYSPFFQQAGGMLLLMTQSFRNGASVSGNSWGPSGSPLGYDGDTRQVDVGVRDADPAAAGNQPLSYVLSFMNGNGGVSSQGTPDEAKNVFTIGSTKMQASGGSQILQINDVSSNSAHGPALDGRTIPHMVAPGCYVDSTVPTNSYGLNCGTSMASPHVTGAVALFIQYYRLIPGVTSDPSPAMVKAAFLACARSLAGNVDADGVTLGNPFDSKQGWGRMNTAEAVHPTVSTLYFDEPQRFTASGQEWSRVVSAQDPSKPVRLMLVWTDAPGHGLGGSTPAWNNNLDLVVESGASTYRGNNFGASGWSQSGGSSDAMNNTEGVFIGPTAPGAYTVRVVASNINSDGVPNNADALDQDFALVCYNCAQNPGFTLGVTPSQRSVCSPADATYQVNIGQVSGFTGPVALSVSGAPAGTTASFDVNPTSTPGTSTVTISNTGTAAAGPYSLTITGTSGSLTRQAIVGLNVYSSSPGLVSLTSPPDASTGVSVQPTLSWIAAAQAVTYDVQVATDAGFTNIVASGTGLTGTTFSLGSSLAVGTTHSWRVRAQNSCGAGSYSTAFSFVTRVVPRILLVDDDDNSPDVRSFYTNALAAIGQDFDIWDTNNSDNEPSAAQLSPYSTVIWFTGDEFGGACGPSASSESALATFLESGKCLFVVSQDYLYDRGQTQFMTNYLGVSTFTNDVAHSSVIGAGTLFTGFGPYSLSYPFSNFSDRITPGANGQVIFSGSLGNAAISKDSGVYRSSFWGFPLEAVPAAADRAALMNVMVTWCGQLGCNGPRGDMTADAKVDGGDVEQFSNCYLNQTPVSPGCRCADMDSNSAFSTADVTQFVNCVLGISCP